MAAPLGRNFTCAYLKRRVFYAHCKLKLDTKVQQNILRRFSCCQVCSVRNESSDSPTILLTKHGKRRLSATLLNSTTTASLPTLLNASHAKAYTTDTHNTDSFRDKIKAGPGLGDFISASISQETNGEHDQAELENVIPYLNADVSHGRNRNGLS